MSHQSQSGYWDELAPSGLDAAVIDPNDRRGHKNGYLAAMRNDAILGALADAPVGPILDFGCGTGSLTEALVRAGRPVLGIDISRGLLRRSRERRLGDTAVCALYDGHRIPCVDQAVAAVTTYVVMTHIVDNEDLARCLVDCRRVLRPGGLLIAIEQVRATPRDDPRAWKRQRTIAEYMALFRAAGFEPPAVRLLRHGRSPWVQLIRAGVWPKAGWRGAWRLERQWSSLLGPVEWDYCDALFVSRRAAEPVP
jgi:SAM-dependent methyltransferase